MNSQNTLLDNLLQRRVLFNLGKGGVGRSSISALLAKKAAEKGKKVLICEVNAKEQMSTFFNAQKPSSFDTLDQIWQLEENIWAVNIRPEPGTREYIIQTLKLKVLYSIIFKNKYMRYFLRSIPGLQELVYVGKIWFHTTEESASGTPRFDLVIIDAPATGHALALLKISQVVIDTVPAGPMHTAAKKIQELLEDPEKTGINLITLPEEMPVNETIELYKKVTEELKLPLTSLFINQWPSSAFQEQHEADFERLLPHGLQDQNVWPLFATSCATQKVKNKARNFQDKLKKHIPLPTFLLHKVDLASMQSQKKSEQLSNALHTDQTT